MRLIRRRIIVCAAFRRCARQLLFGAITRRVLYITFKVTVVEPEAGPEAVSAFPVTVIV